MQLCGARDRYDPGLLRQNPRERDLSRSRILLLRKTADQVYQRLVRLAIFFVETWHSVAEVVRVKLRFFSDFAREKSLAERAERDEADSEFFQCGQDLLFRLSPPQGVFALQRGDRLHGMCTANRSHTCFRESEVLHFVRANQVFHRTRHVLNRHVGINAVLIKEVDHLGSEAFQRGIGHLLDVLGPAVQAGAFSVFIDFEAKLCSDDDLAAERLESLADKFFIRVGAIARIILEG